MNLDDLLKTSLRLAIRRGLEDARDELRRMGSQFASPHVKNTVREQALLKHILPVFGERLPRAKRRAKR